MNISFITFLIIALAASSGISLLVLYVGGLLVRNDLDRAVAARSGKPRRPSRLLEDLRGVQETVVAFFARTESFRHLLERLTERKEPMSIRALFRSDQRSDGANSPAPEKVLAGLSVMRMADLLRITKRGVVMTDVGREVYRRITTPERRRVDTKVHRLSPDDALFVRVETETSGSSHRERVRAALQNNSASITPRNRATSPTFIGQLRTPLRRTISSTSTESLNPETMKTTPMKRNIIITAADHEELSYAIAAAGKLSKRGRVEMTALEAELARAEIVGADEIPADVITMNSRAELLDLHSGERMEFTLVFPVDADIEAGKISVLAPLGTAMLGYRVGDEFTWIVPYGERRLKITAVHFQPEAAALALAA